MDLQNFKQKSFFWRKNLFLRFDIFLNAIFFGKSEAAFHRPIPRRMLILEVLRATFPILLSPDAKNVRIGCASHFHARPFDFMNIVGERPSFYNSRRATTRIARRTLQRASNARICKRPLPSPTPLFGKSTALFPRINQLEFEGSSKANGVVNGVVRYVLFFSSEISKYRETSRFQDIFLSRNFPFSMKIEWLQNLTNYYELSSISKDLRYFGISFFAENPAKFNKLSCQASSMCSRNFFLSSSTNDCKI